MRVSKMDSQHLQFAIFNSWLSYASIQNGLSASPVYDFSFVIFICECPKWNLSIFNMTFICECSKWTLDIFNLILHLALLKCGYQRGHNIQNGYTGVSLKPSSGYSICLTTTIDRVLNYLRLSIVYSIAWDYWRYLEIEYRGISIITLN